MKKIFLIIILLISHNNFGQNNNLVGKWYGIDENGKPGSILFDTENFVTFTSVKNTYGGKEFELKGKFFIYKYNIDYTKNPIQLEYILYKKESKEGTAIEDNRFKSIVRFIDENTIEIKTSSNSKYPKKFSSKKDKNSIILKRSLSYDSH